MNNKRKYNRYTTQGFVLDTEEKKAIGLKIIAHRKNLIADGKKAIECLIDELKKASPEIAQKLQVEENELKLQKKHLKDSIAGLTDEKITVIADVIVQPAEEQGYLEFIENTGTEVVLLKEPGTEDQICYPEDDSFEDIE